MVGREVRKGLLSEVSIEMGREIQKRHRRGEEEGIPGSRRLILLHPRATSLLSGWTLGQPSTHVDTAPRNVGSD